MPLLAVWIGSLFTSLVGFFASFVTKRLLLIAAAVTAAVFFTGGFISALDSLFSSLAVSMPASIVIGASWVVPSNFVPCASAIISAYILRWVYDWQIKIIQWKINV